MVKSFPNYYREFRCIADKCEATCCAGWQIVVDNDALKRYRKVSGEFQKRIAEGVDFKEGVFRQKQGKRCAFLNDNNLCDMYTALGEEAFCETCSRYPRHIEEFENVREYTLSVSCPEAAEILLSQKEPVTFYAEEEITEEEMFDDFDPVLYEKLVEARTEMIKLIQNREVPLKERAKGVWDFAVEFQNRMDEGTLYIDESLYAALLPIDPETSYEEARALFDLLYHLEYLAEDWEEYLSETKKVLYGLGKEYYLKQKEAFLTWKQTQFPDWDIMLEQLLLYFVYTYFCGAVYDEYVASKVKMSVISIFYLEEMALAKWIKNGQDISFSEFVRIVYRYSRELEHSDENLCTMDEMMEEL